MEVNHIVHSSWHRAPGRKGWKGYLEEVRIPHQQLPPPPAVPARHLLLLPLPRPPPPAAPIHSVAFARTSLIKCLTATCALASRCVTRRTTNSARVIATSINSYEYTNGKKKKKQEPPCSPQPSPIFSRRRQRGRTRRSATPCKPPASALPGWAPTLPPAPPKAATCGASPRPAAAATGRAPPSWRCPLTHFPTQHTSPSPGLIPSR